jgi:diguanylate cyclase (GGDEF)-like protein/PAS domain S-box-containing protein
MRKQCVIDGSPSSLALKPTPARNGAGNPDFHSPEACEQEIARLTALLAARDAEIARLEEAQSRLETAVGAAHEAILIRDRNGNIEAANAAVERILGFPAEDLFRHGPIANRWSLIREDRSEFPMDAMPDMVAMRTGAAQHDCIMGIEHCDGSVIWLSASACPLAVDDDSKVYGAVMTFSDISERKTAFEANARLAAIVDSSQDAIIGATLDGTIVSWNRGAERLFGYVSDEILGRRSSILTPANDPAAFKSILSLLKKGKGSDPTECTRLRKDGMPVHISITYSLIKNGCGAPIGIAAIARDVTDRVRHEELIRTQLAQINEINSELQQQKFQLEKANERLEELATQDGLTGLKNHRVFQEQLQHEVTRATRYNLPLSIVILDVDSFKSYNDTYGHPAGDEVLRIVGEVLTHSCRSSDIVARYGGEEFVMVLPQTPAEGARAIAERCRAKIAGFDWTHRRITASFGISSLNAVFDSPAAMIAAADRALYHSKSVGKNRVSHIFDLEADEIKCRAAA